MLRRLVATCAGVVAPQAVRWTSTEDSIASGHQDGRVANVTVITEPAAH